jgi:hypothetical protein
MGFLKGKNIIGNTNLTYNVKEEKMQTQIHSNKSNKNIMYI